MDNKIEKEAKSVERLVGDLAKRKAEAVDAKERQVDITYKTRKNNENY